MRDGILVVNKPEGISSAAVVGRLKRKLAVKKIGHTGTLDPFATGVLLIAIGKATRISRFFLDGSKAYLAQVTLGVETDTYDCTGKPVLVYPPETAAAITFEQIQKTAAGFQGPQEQVAPAYSALKHNGVPLYKLARQGKAVIKPPRQVEIYSIEAGNLTCSSEGYPVFELRVHCSGGTYIRSLAFDMGRQLGCGGHLSGLIRNRSSQFDIEEALELDAAESMSREEIDARVISMSQCLDFLPEVVADPKTARKIRHGQKIDPSDLPLDPPDTLNPEESFIRAVDETGQLLAVIQPDKTGQTYNYCCVFHQ